MMLPGVELARRRRVHHGHEVQKARDPQDLTALRRSSVLTAMDESAVIARQRLEEKLRRFSAPPSPSSSSSVSSTFSNLILSKARRESYLNRTAGANNEIGSLDGIGNQRPRKGETKRRGNLKELCAVCLDVQCPSCETVAAS